MNERHDKVMMQSNDIVIIEIQCLTCNHYAGSLECDLGIVPDDDMLLNKVACLNYKKINNKYN